MITRRSALVILLFILGLATARAVAGSGYKDIGRFEEGTVATLGIVVEYKPDDSRSIDVRFNRSPLGSTMFFHAEQWKVFGDQLDRMKKAPEGVEQTFPDLHTPGGSFLRMSGLKRGSVVTLTLIDEPEKGDSYPPVPFHLPPADFENLLQAVLEAARAIIIVNAASADQFARFRADLGTQFTPEQLQDFDTAIQELQLAAGNGGIATAAGHKTDMLAVINRKTFPDVVLLGWHARKDRLIKEVPGAIRLVADDTAEAAKTAATGTPESVTRRLAQEKDALAKLRHDRDETIRRLNEMAEVITSAH